MDDLREKVIHLLKQCLEDWPYAATRVPTIMNRIEDAVAILENMHRDAITLLKAQEPKTAYWIHCNGKSHIFYCSNCAEKVSYNNAHRVYNKNMKPIEQVNKFCRGCGYKMIPRPTDEQREAVKWE